MATYSYRQPSHAAPHKTLPITMPSKAPAYHYPSRGGISPPEYGDSSVYSGSRSGKSTRSSARDFVPSDSDYDYKSHYSNDGVDIVDELSNRMNRAFDPIRMDRSIAKQAQTSGELNAKQRELADLQALASRRLKGARRNMDEGMQAARDTRRDLDYTQKRISSMKSSAEKHHRDAYVKASRRSRHDDY